MLCSKCCTDNKSILSCREIHFDQKPPKNQYNLCKVNNVTVS